MTTSHQHPLHRRLRAARVLADLDQLALATELGYKSRNPVEVIERGERTPTAQQVARWARICGLPTEWFFVDFDGLRADVPADPLEALDALDRRIKQARGGR